MNQLELERLCEYCGEPLVLDLLECWPEERAWMFETCCEDYHEQLVEELNEAMELPPMQRKKYLEPLRDLFAGYGIDIRTVIDDDHGGLRLDFGLELAPIDRLVAQDFIRRHHRHNRPPAGDKFRFGCFNGDELIAVTMAGRPVSRQLQAREPGTIEINRVCAVDGELAWNACSMLYGAAARKARQLGYTKAITYTLESEDGTSLRAAGFTPEAVTKGGSWNRPSRARTDTAPTVRKVRWSRQLAPQEYRTACA
jgi:hypothetical protein